MRVVTQKNVERGLIERRKKGERKKDRLERMEMMNGEKCNGLGSNLFVVFVVVWVRDALGPEGTSSSYHSEQTAGTSFSLLASQL